jgi:hypothetical protein
MNTLDLYIRELLFSHNCVIIPGFGGFVSDYNPSFVHPVQHTFTPPSKKIAFNRKLQNDDGLLANFISEKENISFENARRAIEEQVHQLYLILAETNKLLFPSVGEFFYDVEKNLQFRESKKINYLLESFGLDTVQSPAIKREGFSQSVNRQLSERQSIRPSGTVRSKRRKTIIGLSLISVPLIILIVWISIFSGVLSKVGQFNYSALIPYSLRKGPEKTTVSINPSSSSEKKAQSVSHIALPDTEEKVIMDVKIPDPPVTLPKASAILSDEKKAISKPSSNHEANVYFIIGGAFGLQSNAENMVNKLNSDGFNSEIIGKNEKGLYLVSYQGFDSKRSALSHLKQIKADYDSMAWLYRSRN